MFRSLVSRLLIQNEIISTAFNRCQTNPAVTSIEPETDAGSKKGPSPGGVVNDLDPHDSDYGRFLQIKVHQKAKKKESKARKQLQRLSNHVQRLVQTQSIQLDEQERQRLDRLNPTEQIHFLKSKCEPFRAGIHFDGQGRPLYGLWKNSMFVHRKRNDLRQYRPYRLVDAQLSGPKLVFDFSYDQYMNASELRNLGFQIAYCISLAQADEGNPFGVWFSNLATNSLSDRVMRKSIGNLYEAGCHIRTMQESYLDHLPRDKLIYLSPHADQCMEQWEPDCHYVVGAFVDQSFPKALSHLKAQQEEIRCYRLPLDEFLKWKLGCKYLPLPQVTNILIGVKNRQDWRQTLSENVRKMYQMSEEEAEERKERKKKKEEERKSHFVKSSL